LKYFESPAFGEWCGRVYGCDMKQTGMLTSYELKLFYNEVTLQPNSDILDIGCGCGAITADIAKHYKSNAVGININKDEIEYAKKHFFDNKSLDFSILDGNKIDYKEESFDLICFIDTLYISGFIDKLHALLNKALKMLKPDGKIVVFWTNQPKKQFNIFDMSLPTASNTQVGIWGINNCIPFKTFDLTKNNRLFWFKALSECEALEENLKAEIPDYYRLLYDECVYYKTLSEKGDDGELFRWMFIFNKK